MGKRLDSLGWNERWQRVYDSMELEADARPARISVEYQDRVRVEFEEGHADAFLVGRLRDVEDKLERPAVGDWVVLRAGEDDGPPMVAHLLPRRSVLLRRAAGQNHVPQILAANIDRVFIVSSLNREFNPRRIERYIAATHSSGAEPVLVLNKADTIDDPTPFLERLDPALLSLRVIVSSARTGKGVPELEALIQPGETVAFTGSSGVGKSSLLNRLMGEEVMPTADTRAVDDAGRHTTRNRTLLTFPSGGVLIDTPGMRELQLWTTPERITSAFGDIEEAADDCKFRNCGHGVEPGCAVQAEVEAGNISSARAASYRKLLGESTSTTNRRHGFSHR